MFKKVLVANRGEIALRIGRTLRRMGIGWVAVTSAADRFTRSVLDADEHVVLGPAPASESYLAIDRIIAACKATGAEAVHPGYGFLSESRVFAERLAAEGISFIGPRPEHLDAFGLKHRARELAEASGVPLLPGSGLLVSLDEAREAAERIGYPVMLKSTAGGGGIGMQTCLSTGELEERYKTATRTAQASFGDARLYIEQLVTEARHVEVQIFGDGKGQVLALGCRDCSLQRRNQKVIEETPPPGLSQTQIDDLCAAAVALGSRVSYESAGTVEFIFDVARQRFSFLEVNTRLQVEHPVTEEVLGIDLVEAMIRQAAGEDVLTGLAAARPKGVAIEARLYAENPAANFRPTTGRLTEVRFPAETRVDRWIETGSEVTPFYDPMLAKIIVRGETRPEAIDALSAALNATRVAGIETNLSYLRRISGSEAFTSGKVATHVLGSLDHRPPTIEVIAPGAQSSIQELPGRLGLWAVGIPPSGPMDERSFRLANRIVGNPGTVPAIEMTLSGATLRFQQAGLIALTGAEMAATLDGVAVDYFKPVPVAAGQVLAIGVSKAAGQRSYLAIRGSFDCPEIFGSRATFMLAGFGGHATGPLRSGDVLTVGVSTGCVDPVTPAPEEIPSLARSWTLPVLYGPHGAPDFFRDSDIETLFSAVYTVHFNSDRTGVRLIGPKPQWARQDGGEAGLHPSNLHDNAYAVGAIDFTGDMPIILGPDGPSLGGFVCPAVVAREAQWMIGQLKASDQVRFVPVARAEDPVAGPVLVGLGSGGGSAIVAENRDTAIPVVYRRQGDDNLLIEFGDMKLDLPLRMRVQQLYNALEGEGLADIIDLTPGIRSLQVHYDSSRLSRSKLLDALQQIERDLPAIEEFQTPSRIVHLPLSWNDPQAALAMRKYQELTYPDAPWCPSNIEFIRRINGLEDEEAVRKIIFDASYLVMGLGDVYLGAPVATPLDPRHRLVTTKYNPARVWTPENVVGIGGAYLCIYGMEGPGGYQLFGRTIQMWNSWRTTREFAPGKPWLLRFFDQIRFYEVDAKELAEAREAFPHGAYPVRIEETRFSHDSYRQVLAASKSEAARFKTTQQAAFEAERLRWRTIPSAPEQGMSVSAAVAAVPEGCAGSYSEVAGNVWKITVAEGDIVKAGEPILIVESMKMEFAVSAGASGRIRNLAVKPGQTINGGDLVAVIEGGQSG